MSHTSRRHRTASSLGAEGLPIWAGIVIVIAALATGMGISMYQQAIGSVFLWCFALSAIVVSLVVQPRGLFITISTMPLVFSGFAVATAWCIGRQLSPSVSGFSMGSLITAVYPLLQFFPVLFLVLAGVVAIAVVRLWLLHKKLERSQARTVADRHRAAKRDEYNKRTTSRARKRTARATPAQEAHHDDANHLTAPHARRPHVGAAAASRTDESRKRADARPVSRRRDAPHPSVSTPVQPGYTPPRRNNPGQQRGARPAAAADRQPYATRGPANEGANRSGQRQRPTQPQRNHGHPRPRAGQRDLRRDGRTENRLVQRHDRQGQPTDAARQQQPQRDRRGRPGKQPRQQVTVQELIERNEARRRRSQAMKRDLYDD